MYPLQPLTGPFRRSRTAWAVLLLVAMVAGGCSARKIAYNFADRLIQSTLVSLFDLGPDQRRFLAGRLPGHLTWHRHEELPRYSEILARVGERIEKGAPGQAGPRQEMEDLAREVEAAAGRLADRIAPDAGQILSTLTPAQIAHAERAMAERSREAFPDLDLAEEAAVKARVKRTQKFMVKWLGSVTREQEGLLWTFARQNRPDRLRHRDNILRNRQQFIVLLQKGPGAGPLADAMRAWMTKEQLQPTDDFQQAERRSQQVLLDQLEQMERTLSAEQRRYFVAELNSLRSDLLDLSRQR